MEEGARRTAAIGSLILAAGAAVLAVVLAIERFPRGIAVFVGLAVATWAGWIALREEGGPRAVAAAVCVAGLAGALAALIFAGGLLWDLVVVVAFAGSAFLARLAFRARVELPPVAAPRSPFLFYNPLSGDGKAIRFNLADEARRRGILPVELRRSMDLRSLVEDAISGGADAVAMAGGDGSQAVVADVAAAHGIPYACIPSGTRNHFALDLGVDRDDVVGALDAFVDGGERRVDLAEVNGRVFVNNVSIGLYAEAVQRSGYREAKIRTLLAMAPEQIGTAGGGTELRWQGPEGAEGDGALTLLVSNDPYRLGTALGSATRPQLDTGELGVTSAVVDESRHGTIRLRSWSCPTLTVEASEPVAAGIDGEATTLTPPLLFVSRPGVLTVRIARHHPGASPATAVPRGLPATALALVRIAFGGAAATDLDQPEEESPDGQVRGREP